MGRGATAAILTSYRPGAAAMPPLTFAHSSLAFGWFWLQIPPAKRAFSLTDFAHAKSLFLCTDGRRPLSEAACLNSRDVT